jgi:CheY-like chemotaxis protein/anti-sigma regulatory factor (Ser/Thr protein kinase)
LRKLDFRKANIQVTLQLELELPQTEADPDQIQQIIGNLVTNSVQAMERRSEPHRLKISSKRSHENIQVIIEDNGPGVSPDIEQKIFEPFFTTKEVGVGTGLGLSIAHSIMTEHKGKILYQRSSLGGAAFILELPIVEKASETSRPEIPPFAKTKPHTTRSARILVLDDELALAELLCDMLRMLGHQPTFCLNPLAALELMNQRNFDVVLSDFRMPSMSGKEFYHAVYRRDRELARQIIFISGEALTEDTLEFLKTCGNPLLEKPFQISDLSHFISARLSDVDSLQARA